MCCYTSFTKRSENESSSRRQGQKYRSVQSSTWGNFWPADNALIDHYTQFKEQIIYLEDNRAEVGQKLYELRQEHQLSIDDISKLSGLSHHRIKNVEQGKSFGLRRVAVIAAIYNYKLKFELIKAS